MTLDRDAILSLLKGDNDTWLFETARKTTREIFGDEIYLRGIVEFSSFCRCHCNYCGLRAPNKEIRRYRLCRHEIMEAVGELAELNLATVVLQSGEDPLFDVETVGKIITEIKARHQVAITLSLGERGREAFSHWRDCGADRYLLKMETLDASLYESYRPGSDFTARLKGVEHLKRLGYEAGSGIITGLPGMTIETLADDILALTKMTLHMISAGPFVPHPQTPFGGDEPADVMVALRTMAILRILNPKANIPSTSALETVQKEGRKMGIEAGANVLMFSVTPASVRKSYSIYPGKNQEEKSAADTVAGAHELIRSMGLIPSMKVGGSKVQ